jgi:(S)-2-hydroxy-acid oxidase
MANFSHIKAGLPSRGRLLLNARNAKEAKKIAAENHLALNDRSLTWENTIPWLRSQTKLMIIVKGILTAEDALKAVEAGVDALIISNHGGRQLDGTPATLEALPEVVQAVQGRIPVIIDGGITKGSDVFKALALGADLCLIGRSALWGLAYDGEKGVETVLNILERELWRTMTLMGARSVREIQRGMLGRLSRDDFGISRL